MGLKANRVFNDILKKLLGKISVKTGTTSQLIYPLQKLLFTLPITNIGGFINFQIRNFPNQLLAPGQAFNNTFIGSIQKFADSFEVFFHVLRSILTNSFCLKNK